MAIPLFRNITILIHASVDGSIINVVCVVLLSNVCVNGCVVVLHSLSLSYEPAFVAATVEYAALQAGKPSAKINPQRVQMLDSIGFSWDPLKTQWETMYQRLVDFVRQYGHARVPKTYPPDVELANWTRNQRNEQANLEAGKRSSMNAERFALLDRLGFYWRKRRETKPKDMDSY